MIEPLSPRARDLIAQAQGFDEATSTDRSRVQARIVASIAAGAGVSAAAKTAEAMTGDSISAAANGSLAQSFGQGLLSAKKLGALVALAGAGTAALLLWPAPEEESGYGSRKAAPINVAEADVAPEIVEPQVVASEIVAPAVVTPQGVTAEKVVPVELLQVKVAEPPVLEPAPAAVVTRVAVAKPEIARPRVVAPEIVPVTPEIGGQLGAELLALAEIRRELSGGDPEVALRQLSEYAESFPSAVFGVEARALRVDALCTAGHPELARQEATVFLEKWPESPLAKRIRQTCR